MYQLISKKWGLDGEGSSIQLNCYLADNTGDPLPGDAPTGSECIYPDGRKAVHFGNGNWVTMAHDPIVNAEEQGEGSLFVKKSLPGKPLGITVYGTITEGDAVPTPTNPVYPEFTSYIDLLCGDEDDFLEVDLRRLGNVADSIDEKGVIIRRIGMKVFNGTENFEKAAQNFYQNTYVIQFPDCYGFGRKSVCSHFQYVNECYCADKGGVGYFCDDPYNKAKYFCSSLETVEQFKSWLAEQYAAGTPVTLYYLLAEPFEDQPEDHDLTQCIYLTGEETFLCLSDDHKGLEFIIRFQRHLEDQFRVIAERIRKLEKSI